MISETIVKNGVGHKGERGCDVAIKQGINNIQPQMLGCKSEMGSYKAMGEYPLVNSHITMENHHAING